MPGDEVRLFKGLVHAGLLAEALRPDPAPGERCMGAWFTSDRAVRFCDRFGPRNIRGTSPEARDTKQDVPGTPEESPVQPEVSGGQGFRKFYRKGADPTTGSTRNGFSRAGSL